MPLLPSKSPTPQRGGWARFVPTLLSWYAFPRGETVKVLPNDAKRGGTQTLPEMAIASLRASQAVNFFAALISLNTFTVSERGNEDYGYNCTMPLLAEKSPTIQICSKV